MADEHYSFEKAGNVLRRPRKEKLTLKDWVSIFILHENPLKSQLKGAVVACLLIWFFLKKDVLPIFIYLGFSVIISFAVMMYWRSRIKKSNTEIESLNNQMAHLTKELKEKQQHFKHAREELIKKSGIDLPLNKNKKQ